MAICFVSSTDSCVRAVVTSHRFTVPSNVPEARIVPSGENATAVTREVCRKVTISEPVATSHNLTSPLESPDARIVPSGENETENTIPLAISGSI